MVKSMAVKASTSIITIKVDYSKRLQAMISSSGYDIPVGAKHFTRKRFPIVGNGIVEFEAKLFHFELDVSTKKARRLIRFSEKADNAWEPAKTEHVMAFGKYFPRGKLNFPILCLINNVEENPNDPDVLCLAHFFENTKFLVIFDDKPEGGKWDTDYRFLAVRNKRSPSKAI